jgi:acyl-CoA thioesterase-1
LTPMSHADEETVASVTAVPIRSILFGSLMAAGLDLLASRAAAQSPSPPLIYEASELRLSRECRAPSDEVYALAPLKRTKAALRAQRAVKVLAFGSSSTAGVGASSASTSYPFRLELELERLLRGANFAVSNFGVSGELAVNTAERIRRSVSETCPDLLIWQVGTNDALARVQPDTLTATLRTTLRWLRDRQVDVVLLNPQYTSGLASDEGYSRIVAAIGLEARRQRVPLVRRFEAMRHLAQQSAGAERPYLSRDQLHLNDLGYRCMAEHAARAIALSLAAAE